jgi:hypothetical protein
MPSPGEQHVEGKQMTRRLLAFFAPGMLAAQRSLEPRSNLLRDPLPENGKYYVTFTAPNRCFVDPIEVEASSRADALLRCGVTVWSEAEWKEAMKSDGLRDAMKRFRCVSTTPMAEGKEPKR